MRGGTRTGAGRPAKFKGQTKTARVPAEHEERLIEIAHKLEAGEVLVSVTELQNLVNQVAMMINPGDRRAALRYYKKLLTELQSGL
jgi:acyl carrier protein phosphodiesterase